MEFFFRRYYQTLQQKSEIMDEVLTLLMRTKRLEKSYLDAQQKAIEMEQARGEQIDNEMKAAARRETQFYFREEQLRKKAAEDKKRMEKEHNEQIKKLKNVVQELAKDENQQKRKTENKEIRKKPKEKEAELQKELLKLREEFEKLRVKAKHIGDHNDRNQLNQEQTWQDELEKTKRKKSCSVSKQLALNFETKVIL